jgi:ParB-like chromosome segregation protein Spo0J
VGDQTMKKRVNEIRRSKFMLREFVPLKPGELEQRREEFRNGTVPPVTLRGNTLIDGLQRVETAKLLGITHVEAICID